MQLIQITPRQIAQQSVPTVNARELHSEISQTKVAMLSAFDDLCSKIGKFGACAAMLEDLLRLKDKLMAKKILSLYEELQLFPAQVLYLKNAVQLDLFFQCNKKRRSTGVSEKDLENYFYSNLKFLLPGAVRTCVSLKKHSIPDGFVELNKRPAPVEIKLHVFGEKALAQLLGYMRMYGAATGVAVAPICKAVLPPNVLFVRVDPAELTMKVAA